jgi:2-oxoglutarate ferredoxin oxidoreductase subunit delta
MAKSCESSPPAGHAEGDVQVQFLLCKSCGLCAEYCPRGLMKPATEVPADARTGPAMNPAGHIVYVVHDPEGRCTGCGICAQVCPEGAVVVYRRKKAVEPRPEVRGHDQPAADGTKGKKEDSNA